MLMEVVTRENRHLYRDQLEDMYLMRHRIFVERMHWEGIRKADGREIDEFDNDDAIYLLVTDEGQVCGCHRMIPTTKPHLLSEVFADECEVRGVLRGPRVIECGRTCIEAERLPRDKLRIARRVLMTGLMEFCFKVGATHFTGINPVAVMSHYLKLDWDIRPLGAPRKMEDGETYVAVSYAVSEEALASVQKTYKLPKDLVVYRGGTTPLEDLLDAEQPRGHASVTDRHVRDFERNGVVVIRNVIAPEAVEDLRCALDALADNLSQSAAGYDVTSLRTAIFSSGDAASAAGDATQYDMGELATFIRKSGKRPLIEAQKEGMDGHFLLDTTTWLRNEIVRQIALDSNLPRIAAELLQSSKVNFCDDQMFIKAPHTGDRTAVHQDMTYFHLTGNQGCVMWICVDDADASSGAPFYLPGSHLWGQEFAPNVFMAQTHFPGSAGDDLDEIEDGISARETVSFHTKPGDIIVHHFRTVHGAGGNISNRPRRALSLRYAGDDIRYQLRSGAPAQPYHHHALRDGDLLDSRQFPVVWPRPYPEFRLSPLYANVNVLAAE